MGLALLHFILGRLFLKPQIIILMQPFDIILIRMEYLNLPLIFHQLSHKIPNHIRTQSPTITIFPHTSTTTIQMTKCIKNIHTLTIRYLNRTNKTFFRNLVILNINTNQNKLLQYMLQLMQLGGCWYCFVFFASLEKVLFWLGLLLGDDEVLFVGLFLFGGHFLD